MKRKLLLILSAITLAFFPNANFGQAPDLGAASSFVLFTSAGAFENLGPSLVTGDVGTNAGPFTGFPPGTLTGNIYLPGDPIALQASTDLGLAYGYLSTLGGEVLPSATLGNGQVLTPGIYFRGEASTINGDLTLSGGPSDIFIIRIGGSLITGSDTHILMSGGASLDNVYWQVEGQFTLGNFSVFRGTVIADGAINLLEGSTLYGRALTRAGAIALHNNNIAFLGAPLIVDAGADRAICLNESTQIGAAAVAGSTYSWTSSLGVFTSTEANPTVTPLETTTYTVIETVTATGLTGTDSVVVTVNPLPTVTITNPAAVCSPATVDLTAAAVTAGSTAGLTYTYWTDVAGTLSYSTPATATAGTYYIKGTDTTSCYTIKPVIVTVNPLPAAVAGADRAICLNASTQIGATAVSGSTYNWTSNPSGFTSTASNPTVTLLVTTTYTVVETITATGCTNTHSVVVTVNPLPAVTITNPAAVCSPATVDLTAAAVTAGSTAGLTYTYWTDAGASVSYSTPATAPAGTYYVKGTTAAGCYAISPVVVTVNASPTVTITNPATVCPPATVDLTTAAVTVGSTAGLTYTYWTDAAATLPYSTPATATAGTYYIKGTTAANCYDIKPVIVTVNAIPNAFAGSDATICETSSYTLSESSVANAVSQLWLTSGTGSFNNAAALHPVYTPGAADILHGSVLLTFTITPSAPCTVVSDPMILIINHQAIVNAGSDAYSWAGSAFTVSTATAQFASSILWTHNGTGTLTGATSLTPTYTPALGETGVITLTVTVASASPCVSATDQMTITVNPGLRLGILTTKTAIETGFSAVGNVIHYTIDVFNVSGENVNNISVSDANAVITSGNPITILAPGVHATILANHTITQADIDAGQVINCASTSGTFSDGAAIGSSSGCVTITGLNRAQITITKFATETTFHSVGDVIHYTFEVFNCGNITVSNIVVSDPKAVILTGSPISSLAPRHTVTATGEYVITQVDVDAGKITNIAHIAGIDPAGQPVRDDSNEMTLYANQPAQLVVAKFAEETTFKAKGDTIHYEIWVKNFRSTIMSNIVVSDANATITSGSPIFSLSSGKTSIVNAFHIITQQDLDAGKVVNVATAIGKDYYDVIDKATSNEVTIFADQSPILLLTKTAEETSYSTIGDLIHYANEIKNTGNVKITGITLMDPNTITTGSNKIASLNPGESATIRTTHTISQADLNIGTVEQTASISGYDANIQPIRIISNQVIIKGVQNAQIATSLYSAETTYSLEGDLIHYTIEVRNTGNVMLTNLKITDETAVLTKGNSIPGIVPGGISVVTGEHMVTLAELVAGKVINLATATGYSPVGEKISNLSNELTIAANKSQGLTVTKIAEESSYAKVGDIIHYSITIKNNGKVSISNIEVSVPDAKITGNPMIASLPASGFVFIPALHVVTQSDLDASLIDNNASIKGTYPDGIEFNLESNQVKIYALMDLQLNTSISASETSFVTVGQEINYTIVVKNIGNVSLTDIELSSQGDLTFSGSSSINLAPGRSAELSALYTVTVEDLDAGKIVKAVNATAKAPDKQAVGMTSNEITVVGLQQPALSTVASALENSFSAVGDIIHYNIIVKNSGNVSIISTAVTDPNAVIITARPNTILLPGESFMATASHTVTQADIDAGMVVCEAKSVGFDLNGNTIENLGNKVTVFGAANAVTVRPAIENFNLSNFPNPFTYETTIVFDLPEKGEVILKIYDITGREVGQIDQKEFNEGRNFVNWKSNNCQKGLYFLKMISNGNQASRIMSIVN